MEKQIDQMNEGAITKFREELVPDAPDTVRLEKDLGIDIQKLRDFIATLKAKKTDELNTLYSHGTITDKTMDDFYAFGQTRDAIDEIERVGRLAGFGITLSSLLGKGVPPGIKKTIGETFSRNYKNAGPSTAGLAMQKIKEGQDPGSK